MRGGKQGRAFREERRAEKRGEGILGTEVLRPEASVELGPVGCRAELGSSPCCGSRGSRSTGAWLY